MNKFLSILLLLTASCDTGNLTVIADLPSILKEVSGNEVIPNSDLIWMHNDSGNAPKIYGLAIDGTIEKEFSVDAKNKDWEDLTSDSQGNLYIGDFGNNSKKRKRFTILKIDVLNSKKTLISPKVISFKLPENVKSKDFEAFFLHNNFFYLFSKESKKFKVLKIPNKEGEHIAELVSEYNFNQKKSMITSADISSDGTTIALLNHNKVWLLHDFVGDDFFSGSVEALPFDHSSQKEGICFKNKNTLYITDERSQLEGGNLYEFEIN